MKRKAKFRVGQVVHVTGFLNANAYGVITGYDDGRWNVLIKEFEHKCIEAAMRPLTKREKGQP